MLSFSKKLRDAVWLKSLVKYHCFHKKVALRNEVSGLLEWTKFSKDPR